MSSFGVVLVREAEVEVEDVLAVFNVLRGEDVGGAEVVAARSHRHAQNRVGAVGVAENVVRALRAAAAAYRCRRLLHVVHQPVGRVHASAVILVVEARILVDDAQADVIREVPVRGRAAEFDADLVVEVGAADPEVDVAKAGIGAALDDLVDVAGQALAFGRGRRCAGVQLKLLLADGGQIARRVVVERPVHRHTVELVPDLVVVAAADIDGLEPARVARRNVCARERCYGGIALVGAAAAAEHCAARLRGRVDRVDVRRRAGLDEIGRRTRRDRR